MKDSEIEKLMAQQPLREIPVEWKQRLLAGARKAPQPSTGWQISITWLGNVLWPRPLAWATLAAIWIVTLAIQFGVGRNAPNNTTTAAVPVHEMSRGFQEQEKLLAELMNPREAVQPKVHSTSAGSPRSELREERFGV